MGEEATNCAIWPGFMATEMPVTGDACVRRLTSERVDGSYAITEDAEKVSSGINDGTRARLTTWLVDQRLQGSLWPLVTTDVIRHVSVRRPLLVDERAERLLRYLGTQSDTLGERLILRRTPIMAWTESTNLNELFHLENYLSENGLIEGRTMSGADTLTAVVTFDGHRQISDWIDAATTSQAFIAMWFNESMEAACADGIEPAIRDAGYNPFRIDRKEYINKIEDEIIAEIRRSRFLVADFTQGGDGARGSVYYEAGFAHGLGLPVIFSCREDNF